MPATAQRSRRIRFAPKDRPTVFVDFDEAGELDAFLFRLQQTFATAFLAELIKRAAAETILQAVRKKFLSDLPRALQMWVVHPQLGEVTNARHKDIPERHVWAELQASLAKAHLNGDTSEIASLQKRILATRQQMINALNRDVKGNEHNPTWSTLSSGKFRARALDVLDAMTDMDQVHVSEAKGGLTVSWGNLTELNAIKTPSAIQYVFKRGPTRSPYNVLWRHLEYGTGVFATDPEGKDHPNTPLPPSAHERFTQMLHSGYWRFPTGKWPTPYARSITLKGSEGVHALREKSGVMYDADAVRFQAYLGVAIWKSLQGNSTVGKAY